MTGQGEPTVAELRAVVARLIRAGNRLAAALARAAGDGGVAPRPRVRCSRCGYTCPQDRLDDHTECVVAPRITGRPEEWRPGVWEVVCPRCGAAEPFDAVIGCAECGQGDCCCGGGEESGEQEADEVRRGRPGSRAAASRKDGT